MLVLLDTNVLVSAAVSPRSVASQLLAHAVDGRVRIVVSAKLLYELESVLRRRHIAARLAPEDADAFVEAVAMMGRFVADPRRRWALTDNPDDDYLIAIAQMTGATLVTGDKGIHDDHPAGVSVVRPAELLRQLDEEDGPAAQ